MAGPLVSIIIPVYNAEKYIYQTIKSAVDQSWPFKEIIVVNDGSTDRSIEIIKEFNNPEIVIIDQVNQGASAAKQTGLNYAKGEFIQYLDADDILADNKIEVQVTALLNEPGKVAICNTAHFFDDCDHLAENIPDDDLFFKAYLDDPLNFLIKLYGGFDLRGGMIQPNAFLTPRNVLEKTGPWNTDISPCPDEDGEYFCRVLLNSEGIVYQHETLNYYRKSKSKKTLSGVKDEKALSKLVDSVWLKHTHLLEQARLSEEITNIHNATNYGLAEIYVKAYPTFRELGERISNLQKKLSPSLKPGYYKLGGKAINAISALLGWKLARRLQIMSAAAKKRS